MISGAASAWEHTVAVTRPALLLAPADFLDEIAGRLRAAGVQDAVARRESAPLFDFVAALAARQGISNDAAIRFDARHGGVTWATVEAGLGTGAACPRLAHYWTFDGCNYRKDARTCGSPRHLPDCPLPTHPLRKGLLNEAAHALFFFIRDVCGGDLVGWVDSRLGGADPGFGAPKRAERLRDAVVGPVLNVRGIGPKVWSMVLAECCWSATPNVNAG